MIGLHPVDHDPFASEQTDGETRIMQIVRHGATKYNNDDVSVDRIRGWKDIPLSGEGRIEAGKLGQRLRADPPDVIVSSDLHRAAETARIIARFIGIPVTEFSQSFRPWNVGKFAGELTSKAIPILADFAINKPEQPVPGGESFDAFRARLFAGILNAVNRYPGKIAVVTHHRDERLLKAWLKAGAPLNGDIVRGEFNRKGEATGSVETVNIPVERLKLAALTSHLMQHAIPVSHDPFMGSLENAS